MNVKEQFSLWPSHKCLVLFYSSPSPCLSLHLYISPSTPFPLSYHVCSHLYPLPSCFNPPSHGSFIVSWSLTTLNPKYTYINLKSQDPHMRVTRDTVTLCWISSPSIIFSNSIHFPVHFIFLYGWIKSNCVYVPYFHYRLICWWRSTLVLFPHYCGREEQWAEMFKCLSDSGDTPRSETPTLIAMVTAAVFYSL